MENTYTNLMTNTSKDVFIPKVPSVLGAMLMSKVSRQKEGFREDLIHMVESDMINLPKEDIYQQFEHSYVVANGFMEKWGVNYGHSSIKELDHLQMCIENKSRWFTERIETLNNNAFWSYIEYSQRYNPPKDYVTPKELEGSQTLTKEYTAFTQARFKDYERMMVLMRKVLTDKFPHMKKGDVEKLAFENARNVLPLSVKSNMGIAVNLRAFCDGLSELFSHEGLCQEAVDTAEEMKNEGAKVSYGMVKHVEPTAFGKSRIQGSFKRKHPTIKPRQIYDRPVVVVEGAVEWTHEDQEAAGDLALMSRFDDLPKTFKEKGLSVDLLTSEGCHHQLIRHRAFQIQPYFPDVDYGLMLPPELVEHSDTPEGKEAKEILIRAYQESCDLSDRFKDAGLQTITPYVILNANNRPSRFFGNLYAMSHFITLRADAHAQDEIRFVVQALEEAYVPWEKAVTGLRMNRMEKK